MKKNSDSPVLSMLLIFLYYVNNTFKVTGNLAGKHKGIHRMKLDALKDDLRTPSQEKKCNRFIVNCFQKVKLKIGGMWEIHGFYQLRVSLLI